MIKFKIYFLLPIFIIFGRCSNENKTTKNPPNDEFNILISKLNNNTLLVEKRRKLLNDYLIKNKKIDSFYLNVIWRKSNFHYEMQETDSVLFFDKKLLTNSKRIDNTFYISKANGNLGFDYTKLQKYDSAFYYYSASKNNFIKTGDSIQVGYKLLSMAIIQQDQNDFFGSKETLTEALQYLNSNDNKYIASIYNELATNNMRLLNYPDAISYYKKAITTTNSKNDIISYKNNLATAYTEDKMYDDSIKLLNEIISDSLVKKGSARYARILHNLTYARWKNGISNQESSFLIALEIRKKENDKRGQIASYRDLGEYFSKTNPFYTKKYVDTVIQLSKQLKIPKAETDALKLLMNLEPKNTTFKDRYIFLKDSLYKQELKAKTQFAKMKYDDTQKQETIENLTLDKELKTLEIENQKNQKIIAFLSVLICIVSGSFLFYSLKQHHKKDKLKEIYTTETRISQKVHDELANDVYNVMNRIQNNSKTQQEDVLNQLENIYQRTRDISHENGIINSDNNYYHLELKEMLNAYQNEKTRVSIIGLNKTLFETTKDSKKIVVERVLKELMTNMKKHSNASNVIITFKKDKRNILITYVDDGVGIKKTEHFKSNGLQNAENRIKNINGSFNFDTNREKGIAINITLPI